MNISRKYSEKPEKHLWRGLFCASCEITYLSLLKVKSNKGGRNFIKVLFAALKDRESSYHDNEGKSSNNCN